MAAESLRHRPDSQPPGQGAVGQRAHAVAPDGGEDVLLDAAHQQRVRRLLGDEPLQVAFAGHPLRLHDLGAGVGRGADVADLALVHEVGQRAEGLLDVGGRAGAVHLVQVDVVGAETAQRVLDRAEDPATGPAADVRVVGVHRHEELGREDHLVASPLQRLADDLLRDAGGVHVGGVDEVDARVQSAVDDPDRVFAVVVAPGAEHHRAEAQGADLHAGSSERSVVHRQSFVSSCALLTVRVPVSGGRTVQLASRSITLRRCPRCGSPCQYPSRQGPFQRGTSAGPGGGDGPVPPVADHGPCGGPADAADGRGRGEGHHALRLDQVRGRVRGGQPTDALTMDGCVVISLGMSRLPDLPWTTTGRPTART